MRHPRLLLHTGLLRGHPRLLPHARLRLSAREPLLLIPLRVPLLRHLLGHLLLRIPLLRHLLLRHLLLLRVPLLPLLLRVALLRHLLGHLLLRILLLLAREPLLLIPLRVPLLRHLLRHLLLRIPLLLPVPVRLLDRLALLGILLLPLAVLLAGDRLLAAVPGVTGVPRLGALGAVAPTQIGH
ncbi:hypothetical protein [Kitasatospora sp. MAA19]|uniref:hypothetical protein n=1 Tax=Kitasatospora sp. MAA19 TaxID=3035090 RepID=UPI002476F28A|nr:hypothetical protein [Kitasatospora sp. MAA19]